MKTISIKSRTGSDGILKLKVPTDEKGKDIEIVIVIQEDGNREKGWPVNFFKQTYGCLRKNPISRPEQGGLGQRERLI